MTLEEMAWQFAEVFEDLGVDSINEMLAKNVPMDTLEFFKTYAEDFGKSAGIEGAALLRLPNLMLVGYILRILEDRLIPDHSDS